ncbi:MULTISPECIES: DUF4244 domain-containing protein [Brevibacterium]|uniref:DUF4244 domain-containing protein n=2 Tax=Brevibacterium casei TaxID=33889 RepID=A0A449DCK5_9MICO|nr:DUF4244 domain-containing protein [Brevibacterium casei]NJE67501.1 DUF4244 domain-containing protein [Brevibacterium sp. LS14]MBE4694252.1 DUF4244 domain-containing protein [Brevibacterium casei]MBY3577375.1 DUF4244 domain-containing protein [Brevibacterium casei]MCT1549467.1 DUF4244 domain-containing protein [Brevibacterium casei]MCT1561346.1 DUF4244 domain-containing protein [Brevibacterium casei]
MSTDTSTTPTPDEPPPQTRPPEGPPTAESPLGPDAEWGPDTGATTAEYAITTLAACGFAALLVVILKSEPIKELVTGVIQTALGLGG